MKVYILLQHEKYQCSNCGETEYNDVYTYVECLTSKDFENFCLESNWTYKPTQQKLYDPFGFEVFSVIETELRE